MTWFKLNSSIAPLQPSKSSAFSPICIDPDDQIPSRYMITRHDTNTRADLNTYIKPPLFSSHHSLTNLAKTNRLNSQYHLHYNSMSRMTTTLGPPVLPPGLLLLLLKLTELPSTASTWQLSANPPLPQ